MDFKMELDRFLYNAGYRVAARTGEEADLWARGQDNRLVLLGVIREALPGQKKTPLQDSFQDLEEEAKKMMIRFGRQVDLLFLVVRKQNPSLEEIRQSQSRPNVWFLDQEDGKLLVYENQVPEFYMLREQLEGFMAESAAQGKEENRRELLGMLTPVNTVIVGINVIVFLVLSVMGNTESSIFMEQHGAMSWTKVMEQKEFYRIFTSMFLHFGPEHLMQNMIILLVIGSRMERIVGKWRYLVLYLGAGVCSGIASLYFTLRPSAYTVAAGASGAIFGVMGGLLFLILLDLVDGQRKRVRQIGPVGILFMIGSALYYGFTGGGIDNAAHIGGLIGGFILMGILSFFHAIVYGRKKDF